MGNLKKMKKPDSETLTPQTLGGSMFIRNAIQFDYCVCEALASLCSLCDQVVIVDASSTDGTLEMLQEFQKSRNNLKIVSGENWECHEKYDRLRILADIAKSHLKTKWHFMLQADEVVHESSFKSIRKAIKSDKYDSYTVRRMNLFGDLNHYLKYDIPHEHKPVSDTVVRLAKIGYNAYGDAESLQTDPASCGNSYTDEILIMHYGFVRRDKNNLDKTISMQSWFWGEGSQPDSRVVEMAKKGTRYEWELLKSRDLLSKIYVEHPKFVKKWAEERQAEKIPVV